MLIHRWEYNITMWLEEINCADGTEMNWADDRV
jgi:hypothetical protein